MIFNMPRFVLSGICMYLLMLRGHTLEKDIPFSRTDKVILSFGAWLVKDEINNLERNQHDR